MEKQKYCILEARNSSFLAEYIGSIAMIRKIVTTNKMKISIPLKGDKMSALWVVFTAPSAKRHNFL